jgi:hypothetical protein
MKTFKEIRKSAGIAAEALEARLNHTNIDGNVTETLPSVNDVEMIAIAADLPITTTSHNFIITGPFSEIDYNYWTMDSRHAEEALNFFTTNKFQIAVWYGALREIEGKANLGLGVSSTEEIVYARMGENYGRINPNETLVITLLKMIHTLEISKESLVSGLRKTNRKIERFQEIVSSKDNKSTGLEKILKAGPQIGYVEASDIRKQLPPLMEQLTNGLTSRTWGFEIESPDCKGVTPITNSGIEKGDDGSLRSYESSDDCECECDDCVYHECDCDYCNTGSSDPDHCGNNSCATAESAEYRSVGGIQRIQHRGMYELCKELTAQNAEINDTAGTHIHVYAADLTTHQVGQVMATYKRLEQLFSVIAGREDVQYARSVVVDHVRKAIRKSNPVLTADKPLAVNVSNLFIDRGTIEFRQMDCNYSADIITIWAWMLRGLVTCAKRGATISDYMEVKDFNDLVNVYGKFNYFLADENPEQVVYGTKSDKYGFKTTAHSRS